MPPIQFAREPLTDSLWSEALPLLHGHWKEVAHFPDIELSPDFALYAANEAAGVLRCFTAREEVRYDHPEIETLSGWRLVGYALYFVRANPHYRQSVQAVQDVIYLAPSVRGGTGYKFIAWCDEQLAAEGVQAVYQHVKQAHNFGKLLERQGYDLVDLIYAKRLDLPSVVPAVAAAMAEASS